MRILSVSHSAVVAGYHDRYIEIVRQGEVELSLLVPEEWRQFNRIVRLEKRSDPIYLIIARQPICWGLKDHGLRNVTHIYPGMRKLIHEIEPDIVELWAEPFAAVTAQTIRTARRISPGIKIIFFSAQNINKKHPPPFSWFEQYTYQHADFAFVINEEAENVIRSRGWRKGSIILPLGVNPERFRKLDSSSLGRELGLDKFTVGFVGKLERQKGIIDLITACGKLKGEINLLVIGNGSLFDPVRRLISESGIEEDTRIIPTLPNNELPGYLNCMNVLVLPSITLPGLKEQFGRVLIEAMSCGVPVIGSDSGEIPNVIGNAGMIFPEGDAGALRERIASLLNDPGQARELARRGRLRVEEEYTWASIARRQIEVYHKLAPPALTYGKNIEANAIPK